MKTFNKVTLAALVSFGMVGAAYADHDRDDMMEMQKKAEHFGLISADEAKEIALQNKSGFVDDIDLEGAQSGYYYEIEVADENGAEWDVDIDAKTGEVINVRQDH